MAITPLFVASMAALKAELRLSDSTQEDTDAILTRSLSEVRVGLYEKLGDARITEIKLTATSEAPTTQAQLDRTKANLAESLWVKYLLLLELPTLFLDSSAQTEVVWNEEGMAREGPFSRVEKMRADTWNRVTALLDQLEGETNEGGVRANTISPICPPQRPGQSVFGRRNGLSW